MKAFLFSFFILLVLGTATSAQPSYLDSAFGNNGVVITSLGASLSGMLSAVTVQPDNKILVAGTASGSATVIRYKYNGTLDSTFATNGIFTGPAHSGAASIILQPDSKILVAGGGVSYRFNADGTLDNTFGKWGMDSTINYWPLFNVSAITLQNDGKIIIVGDINNNNTGIARLLPNGVPDSSFGTNGLFSLLHTNGAVAVAVMPDGKIVAGGTSSTYSFMALRLQPDGTSDTSFNHTGIAATWAGSSYNICHGMQLQADGKIVLGGGGAFGMHDGDFTLVRFNTDGSFDRTYGDTGVAHIDFNLNNDEIWSICSSVGGKVVAAGYTIVGTRENFAVARIDSNGRPDSSFGNYGRIITAIQDSHDRAWAVAVQTDGKVITAGYSRNGGYIWDMTVARYYGVNPTGIEPMVSLLGIIYPNPVSDKLFISNEWAHKIIKIEVYDIRGRVVDAKVHAPYREVDVRNLVSGYYYFEISFNDRMPIVKKILVTNNR